MLQLQEYAKLIDEHAAQEEACGDRCVAHPHTLAAASTRTAGREREREGWRRCERSGPPAHAGREREREGWRRCERSGPPAHAGSGVHPHTLAAALVRRVPSIAPPTDRGRPSVSSTPATPLWKPPPRKQTQGRSTIGYLSVFGVGEPVISRPVGGDAQYYYSPPGVIQRFIQQMAHLCIVSVELSLLLVCWLRLGGLLYRFI
jgi:hypothetical protein